MEEYKRNLHRRQIDELLDEGVPLGFQTYGMYASPDQVARNEVLTGRVRRQDVEEAAEERENQPSPHPDTASTTESQGPDSDEPEETPTVMSRGIAFKIEQHASRHNSRFNTDGMNFTIQATSGNDLLLRSSKVLEALENVIMEVVRRMQKKFGGPGERCYQITIFSPRLQTPIHSGFWNLNNSNKEVADTTLGYLINWLKSAANQDAKLAPGFNVQLHLLSVAHTHVLASSRGIPVTQHLVRAAPRRSLRVKRIPERLGQSSGCADISDDIKDMQQELRNAILLTPRFIQEKAGQGAPFVNWANLCVPIACILAFLHSARMYYISMTDPGKPRNLSTEVWTARKEKMRKLSEDFSDVMPLCKHIDFSLRRENDQTKFSRVCAKGRAIIDSYLEAMQRKAAEKQLPITFQSGDGPYDIWEVLDIASSCFDCQFRLFQTSTESTGQLLLGRVPREIRGELLQANLLNMVSSDSSASKGHVVVLRNPDLFLRKMESSACNFCDWAKFSRKRQHKCSSGLAICPMCRRPKLQNILHFANYNLWCYEGDEQCCRHCRRPASNLKCLEVHQKECQKSAAEQTVKCRSCNLTLDAQSTELHICKMAKPKIRHHCEKLVFLTLANLEHSYGNCVQCFKGKCHHVEHCRHCAEGSFTSCSTPHDMIKTVLMAKVLIQDDDQQDHFFSKTFHHDKISERNLGCPPSIEYAMPMYPSHPERERAVRTKKQKSKVRTGGQLATDKESVLCRLQRIEARKRGRSLKEDENEGEPQRKRKSKGEFEKNEENITAMDALERFMQYALRFDVAWRHCTIVMEKKDVGLLVRCLRRHHFQEALSVYHGANGLVGALIKDRDILFVSYESFLPGSDAYLCFPQFCSLFGKDEHLKFFPKSLLTMKMDIRTTDSCDPFFEMTDTPEVRGQKLQYFQNALYDSVFWISYTSLADYLESFTFVLAHGTAKVFSSLIQLHLEFSDPKQLLCPGSFLSLSAFCYHILQGAITASDESPLYTLPLEQQAISNKGQPMCNTSGFEILLREVIEKLHPTGSYTHAFSPLTDVKRDLEVKFAGHIVSLSPGDAKGVIIDIATKNWKQDGGTLIFANGCHLRHHENCLWASTDSSDLREMQKRQRTARLEKQCDAIKAMFPHVNVEIVHIAQCEFEIFKRCHAGEEVLPAISRPNCRLHYRNALINPMSQLMEPLWSNDAEKNLITVDMNSMYPSMCVNNAFCIGRPKLLSEEELSTVSLLTEGGCTIDGRTRFYGMLHVIVLPPTNLMMAYIPITVRSQRRVFALCRKCAEVEMKLDCKCKRGCRLCSIRNGCRHTSEERSFEANLVHTDVEECLRLGYSFPKLLDAIVYTSQKLILKPFFSFLLRKKIMTSADCAKWDVKKKKEFCSLTRDFLGEMNPERMVEDKILQSIIKMCLLTTIGKLSARTKDERSVIEFCDNSEDLNFLLASQGYKDMRIIEEHDTLLTVEVHPLDSQECLVDRRRNLMLGAQILAYARKKMYLAVETLKRAGFPIVMVHADAVTFEMPKDSCIPLPISSIPGQFKLEHPGKRVAGFAALSPYTNSTYFSDGTSKQRVRGFSLGHLINKPIECFSQLKAAVDAALHEEKELYVELWQQRKATNQENWVRVKRRLYARISQDRKMIQTSNKFFFVPWGYNAD